MVCGPVGDRITATDKLFWVGLGIHAGSRETFRRVSLTQEFLAYRGYL